MHLHHVGFVVPEIASAVTRFAASVGATWDGAIIHDPIQKVKVTFLATSASDAQMNWSNRLRPTLPWLLSSEKLRAFITCVTTYPICLAI